MATLKFRAQDRNLAKKLLIYRIQGGLWLHYYEEFDGYYLTVPQEVAESINAELEAVGLGKYKLDTKPREKDGKTYTDVSFGVKVYELRDKIGTQKSVFLADVALRFSEFTFGKKQGRSTTMLDAKVGTSKRDWLASDDFFDEVESSEALSDPSDNADSSAPNGFDENGDQLPF